MSSSQKITGLSLKVGPLGENDRLLTILSDIEGVSRLAIPGARKPKSRLHATSPLNLLELNVVGKSSLKKVTQLKIIRSFGNLGKRIETLSAAQAISELIIISIGNKDPHPGILKTVLIHLNRLDEINQGDFDSTKVLAIAIQACTHLLALSGYCIPVNICCRTGVRLEPPIGEWTWKCSFLPEEGFTLEDIPFAPIQLNPSELALLQRLLRERLPLCKDGKIMGPQKVWLKLLTVLECWIEMHLERRVNSLEMLREVLIEDSLS